MCNKSSFSNRIHFMHHLVPTPLYRSLPMPPILIIAPFLNLRLIQILQLFLILSSTFLGRTRLLVPSDLVVPIEQALSRDNCVQENTGEELGLVEAVVCFVDDRQETDR